MGFFLLPALCVELFAIPIGQDLSPAELGPLIVCQIPGCLFVLLVALFWPMGLPWLGDFRLWRTIGLYCGFLALWYPLVIFGYPLLLQWLDTEFESQSHLLYFVGEWDGPLPWFAAFTACIAGPVAEEIMFRGYLTSGLLRFVGRHTSLILVALLFGLFHGPLYALPMFGMGLCFGYLRQSSGGLAAPILVHILHNSHTLLMAWVSPSLIE